MHTAQKVSLFLQTSLKRFVAGPLVLQYMQNTIEPNNKAIIFVPKRTCLFLGTMDVDSSRVTYCEVRKGRQGDRVNAIREEQGYIYNHAHAIRRKRK